MRSSIRMTNNVRLRTSALWALVLSVSLSAIGTTHARAQSRVIVLEFGGPSGSQARTAAVRALGRGETRVVSDSEVQRAAQRLGEPVESEAVAAEVGASAYLDGRVRRRGRRFLLELQVRDASGGGVLADENIEGRNRGRLIRSIRSEIGDRVGFAIARGRVPQPAPEPEPVQTPVRQTPVAVAPVPDDEEADDAESYDASEDSGGQSGPRLRPLYLSLGALGFNRNLSYNEDIFANLNPYELPIGWMARARVRWYPGAHVTNDMIGNLGLDVLFGGALALRSRQNETTSFGTDSLDFRGAVDFRLPFDPIEIGLNAGVGLHTFTLGQSEMGQPAPLPNVEYLYFRPAVRGVLQLGLGLYIEADFGWRFLFQSGQIAEPQWFPHNEGMGLDLGGYIGWESDIGLGARAGFEMTRYWFAMNSQRGDTSVAGGAIDQYLGGAIELVWRPVM